MPTLESFIIDHTKIKAPSIRKTKLILTPKGERISVFDLRFCVPNTEIMSEKGIHTLEHFFADFMRKYINCDINQDFFYRKVIDLSPMGCRTGFYLIILGKVSYQILIEAWKKSMHDILKFDKEDNIPGANKYQCGSYMLHSLLEAQLISRKVLDKVISVLFSKDLVLDKY